MGVGFGLCDLVLVTVESDLSLMSEVCDSIQTMHCSTWWSC